MVSAELLRKIGPLAEEYFLYFEDADLCFRAREAGWRVEIEPRALARHDAGSALQGLSGLAAYCRARGRIHFSRRWAPPGSRAALARLRFAVPRLFRGGAAGRGALDGLRGRMGPPPERLFSRRPAGPPGSVAAGS
jgi:hypothetical protein